MAKADKSHETEATKQSDVDMWSGFERIETDNYMFNPNEGCDLPLVGFILNVIPMPPVKRGKNKETGLPELQDWDCFVVRTTKPTIAIDREKNPITLPAGKEVLIPATYMIAQHMTKVATHPKSVFEVLISPKKKVALGNGNKMWTWDLGINMKSETPRSEFGAAAILGEGNFTGHQLPSAGKSAASDIVGEGQEVTEAPAN